ncbi:choice-of-anchor Q domain-containing protein, partial [Undibacterium arcticum]
CGYYQGIYLSTSGIADNNLIYAISNTGITSWHNATNLTITNNTVFGNGQGITIGGGGYYNGFAGPHDYSIVANNIVYDNTGTGIDEEGTTGTHNQYMNNLSYGNGGNFSLRNGLTHTGTITADPQFANYIRTGGGDYRLKNTSPAIATAAKTYLPTIDLPGATRLQADMGAYKY